MTQHTDPRTMTGQALVVEMRRRKEAPDRPPLALDDLLCREYAGRFFEIKSQGAVDTQVVQIVRIAAGSYVPVLWKSSIQPSSSGAETWFWFGTEYKHHERVIRELQATMTFTERKE